MRRSAVLALALALVGSPLALTARAAPPAPDGARCGPGDLPEEDGQIQGDVPLAHQEEGPDGVSRAEQGYNCGLALLGHLSLTGVDGRATSNANMAWVKDCAYVAGDSAPFGPAEADDANGVAVVDVRNPRAPRHVTTLNTATVPNSSAASTTTLETIAAAERADGRAVLVVGTYGNQSGGNKPMDIYDVSDCASPRLVTTFTWPENIHNLTISDDLRYVFATQPLQVVDIADPAKPVFLGNLEHAIPSPLIATGPVPDLDDDLPQPIREARPGLYSAHEAWPVTERDPSTGAAVRRLLYLGGQLPTMEAFTIVDVSDWLDRRDGVADPPKILSQREGRGHSVRTATILGRDGKLLTDHDGTWRRFVLHSEESVFGQAYGCFTEELNPIAGAAEPWITDATDDADPQMRISQFHLDINRQENCAAQQASGVQASVHYHDFDRPDGARFVMLSMQNAGIRVVDVRDPEHPVEVAYFNPGDVDAGPGVQLDNAWGHVRYKDGNIWFATASGGFWVVELEPQVRRHFDLAGTPPVVHPDGAPGIAGLALTTFGPPPSKVASMYCTLGAVTQVIRPLRAVS